MPESHVSTLLVGAQQLGVTLTEADARRMLASLDELDEWNQRMNLTAIRERPQQVTKHLLDSLSVAKFIRGPRVLDVGTGAGFPGLPLAIAMPDIQFTLLDSTAKKLKFIEHAAHAIGASNVETVHTRAESFRPKERFDTVVSRAVGAVGVFVEWAGHLCIGGGRLLAMKGRYPTEELQKLPSGWKVAAVHRLSVPGLDEERHLVEVCRSHDKI
ncbi:MAG TPA: 16S rRNA (guanine(527)-N(7))-methyltransferase RsmG [Steroidobacteraceae bacterium]|nr:16S rRNA (guanine(527)-N(7))-methyltransferase RsmG [Steroidobacteraceae bacterium]